MTTKNNKATKCNYYALSSFPAFHTSSSQCMLAVPAQRLAKVYGNTITLQNSKGAATKHDKLNCFSPSLIAVIAV